MAKQKAQGAKAISQQAISDFWRWFVSREKWIGNFLLKDPEVVAELKARLERIHPDLTWEMDVVSDRATGQIQRPLTFAVSADGIRDAFPAVEETVAAAPVIDGWQIQAFRQPDPQFDRVFIEGQWFTMSDLLFTLDGQWGQRNCHHLYEW